MIRIRFFGPRELNQNGFRAAQYRQWSIADGNDTTPMEFDALMKGKGKNKEQREGQRERQSKEQGQAERRNARQVEYEVFLLQGERPRPKGLPRILGLVC